PHRAIAVGPDQFIAHMAELSHYRARPDTHLADVAIAEMSRIARQTVKVALSGEGADEVFAGYPKYALANVPSVVGLGVRALGAERAATMASWLGVNRSRVLIATRALSQPNQLGRIAQWFSNFDRADLARLFPGIGWSDAEWAETLDVQRAVLAAADGAASPLFRMQAVDCASWLPGNMLERGDRMSMARGLEVRPPFLDKELVAFGLGLPDRMKVRGGVGKWIVRRWADELLPAEIIQRKKWGFRVPLAQWFRGPLRAFLTDYLTRANGLGATYGDPAAIRRLLDEHQSGAVDASTSLWTLLGAEVWYQEVYLPRTATPSQPAEAELV
ncbi:MAG: asparagine synthetase B, partial [Proteobacteria bacterium]|nr:asparagine synthetase B [Pseudomonadota bacterium]